MINLYQQPTFADGEPNMGLLRVIKELHPFLSQDYSFVSDYQAADVIISHAGSFQVDATHALNPHQAFIAVVHGFYPTGDYDLSEFHYKINAHTIANCVIADAVIVPSRWVGLPLEREMLIQPHVIHWGVNWQEWQHNHPIGNYVLWNKNRVDEVCDPRYVQSLASVMPNQSFISTFGNPTPNLKVLPPEWNMTANFNRMKPLIQQASVYLATTKETGDIGSREALASGVPVVAFAQGAVLDFLQHGVNGYLVEVGDIDGLAAGVAYCQRHRATLSANARELARDYVWERAAGEVKSVIEAVHAKKQAEKTNPLISVVIPVCNYAAYVGQAIESALNQVTSYPFEVIVVNDASTDNSLSISESYGEAARAKTQRFTVIHNEENQGVAQTRNRGFQEARGKFCLALDADDQLTPNTLHLLASALLANPYLGIAFGRVEGLNESGQAVQTNWLTLPFDFAGQVSGKFNQVPTCCMVRREDVLRLGGYRTHMQPAEDADLWARLVAFTGKGAKRVTDGISFIYRLHAGSLSRTMRRDPYTERGEPTWANRRRPMAAPPARAQAYSNPVRNYENPLVQVVLDEPSPETLDSLWNQSLWQWTLESTPCAPFVIHLDGNTVYSSEYLATLFKEGRLEKNMACCGNLRQSKGVPMNRDDFVLVDWLEDQRGSPISSFSKQRGENGRVLTYTSDFMAGITRSLVHKKDLEAKGYEERASRLWRVVAVVETQVVFNPTPPPAPEPPVLVESLVEDTPVLVQATVPVLEELPPSPPAPKNPGGNVSSGPKQVRKR